MEESAQWGLALLVGIPIAIFLVICNKSGSDFKDGFQKKNKEAKKEKWQTIKGCCCCWKNSVIS